MNKKGLSNKILTEIKEKKLKPRPKWQFSAKKIIFSGGLALFVALSSAAISVMIFLLANNDWDLRDKVSSSMLRFLFVTLPYLWIALFVFFLLVSYLVFRGIKGTYRYKLSLVAIVGVIAIAVLSSIFYKAGVAKSVDLALRERMPVYHKMMQHREDDLWLKPEEGVLIGKVIDISNDKTIIIEDPRKNIWQVSVNNISEDEWKIIKQNWAVKIVGEVSDEGFFNAFSIRIPPKGFFLEKMRIEIPVEGIDIERNILQLRTI